MNATYAAPPPGRPQEFSPISNGSGSEWSGMNNYNPGMRTDGNYNGQMGYPRNDTDVPLDSAPYNGPPPRQFQPSGREGPPRPRRPSESGSQQSSRAGSIANSNSRSSDGTISDQQSRKYRKMEYELSQHYTVLKNFLKGGAPQPPRPNKARDKLLRLSPGQFHELSTDVFDELQRRQAAAPLPGRGPRRDNVPPFLQPRPEFHEKRNQARQKLSSLQTARFRDLSTDVFCELERRFPHFASPDVRHRDSARSVSSRGGRAPPPPRVNTANLPPPGPHQFPPRSGSIMTRGDGPSSENPPGSGGSNGGELGRPIPKQFQSNTITPIKSTMVEDDEDDLDQRSSDAYGMDRSVTSPSSDRDTPATSIANHSRDKKSLQDKISDLESTLRDKDDDMTSLRDELEKKVQDAERLHRSLREEIEKLQSNHANRERDLQAQLSAAKRESEDGGLWKTKHDQLQRNHTNLQSQLEEQQRITDEVGKQGEAFLREMRAMADEHVDVDFEREEKLELEVVRLQKELLEWKNRFMNSRTQTSANKSIPTNGIRPTKLEESSDHDHVFWQHDGVIKDVHVTRFQIAIDELLEAARTQGPKSVMEVVRAVVLAVRDIALDVDAAKSNAKDAESLQKRIKLKERLSATANNMITACKNHAAAGGLSPVSLLDAAASQLSAAVVELARLVKVRSMSKSGHDELHDEEVTPVPDGTPDPVNDAGYFTMSQRLREHSPTNSIYSALSTPEEEPQHMKLGVNGHAATHEGPGSTGLGIQAGLKMREDDTELQELKIYLENQTDLLVQDIQALVSSIRNDEDMPGIQAHINAILDVVENVLSATEGAMDDESWFQATLKQRATPAVNILALSKDKLVEAANDPQAQANGPPSKTFTQKLPPLAFRLARDTKDLVSRIESVESGQVDADDDDFS